MKNKLISIALSALLLAPSVQAVTLGVLEEQSSTSAGQWKDPSSGMTYQNFGSVHFKFKKNVSTFAPWAKVRPPSITAGCGGISFDAGFAAFLDLETIGKQLEQAAASVGMGVIVVLLQTLPSIAKAFENVQKLIRKMQSMLANACQTTTSILSKNKYLKDAKDSMDDVVSDKEGVGWFNDQMGGLADKMDIEKNIMDCTPGDAACDAFNKFMGINASASDGSIEAGSTTGSGATVTNKDANNVINSFKISESNAIYKESLYDYLSTQQFHGKLVLTQEEAQKKMIILGMFGAMAVPYAEGAVKIAGLDENATNAEVGEEIARATRGMNNAPTYKLAYKLPIAKSNEVVDFLTGRKLTGAGMVSMNVASDYQMVAVVKSTKATQTGGPQGSVIGDLYLERNNDASNDNFFTVTWAGIEKETFNTIMHILNPSLYPTAGTMGVYMPKGSYYVGIIKSYADPLDYEKYANLLAKINVKYAVQQLVTEARKEAMAQANIKAIPANVSVAAQYMKIIDTKSVEILEEIKTYSGDVVYLNNLDQIFLNIKKVELEKRLNRSKGL